MNNNLKFAPGPGKYSLGSTLTQTGWTIRMKTK